MPSTLIRAFSYNVASRELIVIFQLGRRYAYKDVPETVYHRMQAAFSKGEFVNVHIRDHYPYVRSDAAEYI